MAENYNASRAPVAAAVADEQVNAEEAPIPVSTPFHLIVRGLRDLAGMELSGLELQPELPQAVPVTMKKEDGMGYLVGLDFYTAEEAEKFADGLSAFCDLDGARLILKRPPAINQDERGNCSGVN
jgi:hypothetical protein